MSRRPSAQISAQKKDTIVVLEEGTETTTINESSSDSEIDQYCSRHMLTMMIAGTFIGLLVLIQQIVDIRLIQDFQRPTVGFDFIPAIVFNTFVLWAGIWSFGKRYFPAIVYTFGLFVNAFALRGFNLAGLHAWLERSS